MRNKIALGTVQFGLDYGINNTTGQISTGEIKKILKEAELASVSIIDTAQAYGNSEERLGQEGVEEFDLVSKFSNLPEGANLRDVVLLSLQRLKLSCLYGILFHDFNFWLSNPQSWKKLAELKKEGLVKKIGFSLYHPSQWKIIEKKGIVPDLLQIPMNVLNQQFLPFLSTFKELGIEVHVRSAFLQGLLLMNIEDSPAEFAEARPQLEALEKTAISIGVDKIHICLLWLLQNQSIDHIVLGIDSVQQWKENLQAAEWCINNLDIKINASQFNCEKEEIINPSKWKKR